MVEVLRDVLFSLVVVSLGTVLLYMVGFASVAVVTSCRRSRPDPLAAELDAALDEILGRADALGLTA